MRLYNDGVAFRYEYTNLQNSKVPEEHTTYIIPEGTKRWMMQWYRKNRRPSRSWQI